MLTDAEVRKAKPRATRYKLYDSGGLYVVVETTGSRLWRMRYALGGREKLLSFGPYPEVSLASARAARDAARQELRDGLDPSLTRQTKRAASVALDNRFEKVARDWHARNRPSWQSAKHAHEVLSTLENNVFPDLGRIPLRDITPPMVLNVLRKVEQRRANETTHRIRQRISAVFQFAIAGGLAELDPAAMVGKALAPVVRGRQPALLSLDAVKTMLAAVEACPAHAVTKLAHRLMALTATRSGELRAATWGEFSGLHGDAPLWTIPAAHTKLRRDHLVPLSRQAADLMLVTQSLTGSGPLPFPNSRWAHRPMSENAIGYLLNRAGYAGRHVPHGWRAAFSTIMNETSPSDRPIIDLMLAHLPQNETEAAYNRSMHLQRRRSLAQTWADMLLEGAEPNVALLDGPAR